MARSKWLYDIDRTHLINTSHVVAFEIVNNILYARTTNHDIYTMDEFDSETEAIQFLKDLQKDWQEE